MPVMHDLKVGERLCFTPTLAEHLRDLRVSHSFSLGDELDVLEISPRQPLPVLVGETGESADWCAWIFLTVAEQARQAYYDKYDIPYPASALDVPMNPVHLEHMRYLCTDEEWAVFENLCSQNGRVAMKFLQEKFNAYPHDDGDEWDLRL